MTGPEHMRVRVEQALARGDIPDRIATREGIDPATVETIADRLDEIHNEPDEPATVHGLPCTDCRRLMVPRGRDIPEGWVRHGRRERCEACRAARARSRLTPAQFAAIERLTAYGVSVVEIARRVGVAERTVARHRARIRSAA